MITIQGTIALRRIVKPGPAFVAVQALSRGEVDKVASTQNRRNFVLFGPEYLYKLIFRI